MKFLAQSLLTSFFVFGLISCAGQAEKPLSLEDELKSQEYLIGKPVDSIRNYRLNGWNHIDDMYITVTSGVSDKYLIGFRNRCTETKFASNIAFTNTAGRLTKSDKIIVSASGGYREQCFIKSIFKLEKMTDEGGQ